MEGRERICGVRTAGAAAISDYLYCELGFFSFLSEFFMQRRFFFSKHQENGDSEKTGDSFLVLLFVLIPPSLVLEPRPTPDCQRKSLSSSALKRKKTLSFIDLLVVFFFLVSFSYILLGVCSSFRTRLLSCLPRQYRRKKNISLSLPLSLFLSRFSFSVSFFPHLSFCPASSLFNTHRLSIPSQPIPSSVLSSSFSLSPPDLSFFLSFFAPSFFLSFIAFSFPFPSSSSSSLLLLPFFFTMAASASLSHSTLLSSSSSSLLRSTAASYPARNPLRRNAHLNSSLSFFAAKNLFPPAALLSSSPSPTAGSLGHPSFSLLHNRRSFSVFSHNIRPDKYELPSSEDPLYYNRFDHAEHPALWHVEEHEQKKHLDSKKIDDVAQLVEPISSPHQTFGWMKRLRYWHYKETAEPTFPRTPDLSKGGMCEDRKKTTRKEKQRKEDTNGIWMSCYVYR